MFILAGELYDFNMFFKDYGGWWCRYFNKLQDFPADDLKMREKN